MSRGALYQAYQINLTGINDSVITNVTIYFQVNKSWLINENGTTSNIFIFRYTGDKWVSLLTTYLRQDSQYYYFSAISPGFSTFIIFFGELTCNPGDTQCVSSQIQTCLGNSTWLVIQNCVLGCNNNGSCNISPIKENITYIGILIVTLITIVAIIITVRFSKKEK